MTCEIGMRVLIECGSSGRVEVFMEQFGDGVRRRSKEWFATSALPVLQPAYVESGWLKDWLKNHPRGEVIYE